MKLHVYTKKKKMDKCIFQYETNIKSILGYPTYKEKVRKRPGGRPEGKNEDKNIAKCYNLMGRRISSTISFCPPCKMF